MADPLIKSINHAPRVRDSLKKPDAEKQRKQQRQNSQRKKKDNKRIIDTYAWEIPGLINPVSINRLI